ncbi:MAG TPA: hypothetical protein VE987_04695 [Polyangiaceae bacterium]|nr:hypothetical protein [Polyangiaceae bacterium]
MNAAVSYPLGLAAQLHPEQVGQGSCRPPDMTGSCTSTGMNECPLGTECDWCHGTGTLKVTAPAPYKGATATVQPILFTGYLDDWCTLASLSLGGSNCSAGVCNGPQADFVYSGNALGKYSGPTTLLDIGADHIHVIVNPLMTVASQDHTFTSGELDANGATVAWTIATAEVNITFTGPTVQGTLQVSDGKGASATLTFSATYQGGFQTAMCP